jgi:CTP synthase
MQIMLIEFARNLIGLKGASSMEFDKMTPYPVVTLLGDQAKVTDRGGTMRLGAYPCSLIPGTKAREAYGLTKVLERHRHRYEFNNYYRDDFEKKDIIFSGVYKEKNLVEIAELKGHRFMLGVQFHPEFLSRPLRPHPLFKAFIKAIVKKG